MQDTQRRDKVTPNDKEPADAFPTENSRRTHVIGQMIDRRVVECTLTSEDEDRCEGTGRIS